MANFEIANSFLNYTIDTTNSSADKDTNHPKANLKKILEPSKTWANQNLNDAYLIVDCGAVQSELKWYIDNANFTSYYILGDSNPADIPTSPDYTSPAQTTTLHYAFGRRWSFSTIASFGYRYVGIKIPTGSSTDGATEWHIGSFAIATNLTELTANPKFELVTRVRKPVEVITFPDGSYQVVENGPLNVGYIELDFSNNRNATENQEIWTWFFDPALPVLVYENRGVTSNAYLCQPATIDGIEQREGTTSAWGAPNIYNFGIIRLNVVSL